jgi:enamine deaminase RidA (YjgF/YER057c/UK114 family)
VAAPPVIQKRAIVERNSILRRAGRAAVCLLAIAASLGAQKKKKEEATQILQVPKDLPAAVSGDPRHFTFHTTPLSGKGLLSAQIREALKALSHETGGNSVLHIRAFVAGSGDLRRVRDLVSETFTDRKQPLPALSLIRAGGLPMEGAQVILEGVAAGKKEVNPNGLVFIQASPAVSDNPLDPLPPLATLSLERLRETLKDAGSTAPDVLRVTCFISSLDYLGEIRKLVEAEYPRAAVDYIQAQRSPARAVAACEAVARLARNSGTKAQFVPSQGEPRAALITAPQVVLTGTQMSYGYQDADSRLAFERLVKSLEAAGVAARDVANANYYPLAEPLAAQVRKLRLSFFPGGPSSIVLFEGLASMDAGFAIDAVAVK